VALLTKLVAWCGYPSGESARVRECDRFTPRKRPDARDGSPPRIAPSRTRRRRRSSRLPAACSSAAALFPTRARSRRRRGARDGSYLVALVGDDLRGALPASRLLELDDGAALPAACSSAAADRRQGWNASPRAHRRRPARSPHCCLRRAFVHDGLSGGESSEREREKNEWTAESQRRDKTEG
jgi:hypothetical protein